MLSFDLCWSLEDANIIEWPFQFLDAKAKCTIKTKMLKKFNKIGLEVFVVLRKGSCNQH
jgi:hypothetical protein